MKVPKKEMIEMILRVKKGILCALFLFLLLPGLSRAAEFSADMAISSKSAGTDITGKVFVKGSSLRQELNTPAGVQTMIIPAGGGVMYILLPGQKMYMEMANTQVVLGEKENIEAKLSKEGKLTKKGTETIDGHLCDIYFIDYTDSGLGESTIWLSRDLNYPLKIHAVSPKDSATITYKNVTRKSLNNSLFILPPGYKKFSM